MSVIGGAFASRDATVQAIERLKTAGLAVRNVLMPVPDEEILEAFRPPRTRVGLFTLAGGIFGVVLGFGGASWAHEIYRLIVGGKPVISVPPFIIVAFEMLILFGGLATLAGVILLAGLPHFRQGPQFDPRVSEDHYVVIVEAPDDQTALARDILTASGAEVQP